MAEYVKKYGSGRVLASIDGSQHYMEQAKQCLSLSLRVAVEIDGDAFLSEMKSRGIQDMTASQYLESVKIVEDELYLREDTGY
jgi:hypothetical protein